MTDNRTYETKLDLALRMLQQVKEQSIGKLRCWVAIDSWYIVKSLYLVLTWLHSGLQGFFKNTGLIIY
jgi:hypothetical protein